MHIVDGEGFRGRNRRETKIRCQCGGVAACISPDARVTTNKRDTKQHTATCRECGKEVLWRTVLDQR